jgi:hypothetical protein
MNRRNAILFLDKIYENASEEVRMNRKYGRYLVAKSVFDSLPEGKDRREASKTEDYILSPSGEVWKFKGLKKLGREIGKGTLRYILDAPEGYVSLKFGWGKPTKDQISAARASNSLIEKFY